MHSQEVYIPLDINQSPFNVGVGIKLAPFDIIQVKKLLAEYKLRLNDTEVNKLMTMLGGHPYLVRVALYHLTCQYIALNDLLENAPTLAGLFTDHLQRHLNHLNNDFLLSVAMKQVVATGNPVRLSENLTFKLHSMGLILIEGNYVAPRCNLYRLYFRDRLNS